MTLDSSTPSYSINVLLQDESTRRITCNKHYCQYRPSGSRIQRYKHDMAACNPMCLYTAGVPALTDVAMAYLQRSVLHVYSASAAIAERKEACR